MITKAVAMQKVKTGMEFAQKRPMCDVTAMVGDLYQIIFLIIFINFSSNWRLIMYIEPLLKTNKQNQKY